MTRSYITMLEGGPAEGAIGGTLRRLAKVLGVLVTELLDEHAMRAEGEYT